MVRITPALAVPSFTSLGLHASRYNAWTIDQESSIRLSMSDPLSASVGSHLNMRQTMCVMGDVISSLELTNTSAAKTDRQYKGCRLIVMPSYRRAQSDSRSTNIRLTQLRVTS